MLPTSLYIHMPWCIRKCPYCDFNSHKSPETLPEDEYVDALIADMKQDLLFKKPKEINTIFIGGGTPSLFSGTAYDKLFEHLQQLIPFARDIEITLEANPGTVEQQQFKHYRKIGINRLSLGIQSFNKRHLHTLGRIHDDEQAHRAIYSAREAGFDNINLDIMHSLPHQSIEEGLDDLEKAFSYQPEHLSWYQLTLEPNTVFYKQRPRLPSEKLTSKLEDQAMIRFAERGYQRYEISAYSLANRQARHNLNYWLFGDYFGIGAGAHGKLTQFPDFRILRTRKCKQPKEYLNKQKPFLAAEDCVDAESLLFEFMLNTTRLQQKIPYTLFTERTGLSFSVLHPKLLKAAELQLLFLDEHGWQVTDFGRRYTNNLQELFLPS